MHYIIMAGGKGSRFGGEKLVAELCGKRVIDFIIGHMSAVTNNFVIATSHNAPDTRKYLIDLGYDVLNTPGLGYPQDVKFLQDNLRDDLLLLNGDAVFISPDVIRSFISKFEGKSMTGITLYKGTKVYIGLNIASPNSIEDIEIPIQGELIHLNINTREDLMEASKKCKELCGL